MMIDCFINWPEACKRYDSGDKVQACLHTALRCSCAGEQLFVM